MTNIYIFSFVIHYGHDERATFHLIDYYHHNDNQRVEKENDAKKLIIQIIIIMITIIDKEIH